MAPTTPFERYKILMGGEQNLPKQYPVSSSANKPAASSAGERGSITPTNDEYLQFHSLQSVPSGWESSGWETPTVSSADWETQERERLAREVKALSQKRSSSPKMKPKPLDPSSDSLQTDKRLGEVSPLALRFCPILALAKFPYRYLPKSAWNSQQLIASKFFDEGKFWQRDWNLYYVASNEADTDKVFVFVTETQAMFFINEIDCLYPSLNIRVPDEDDNPGFICDFPDDPLLRPHWLGHSKSRKQYDFLESVAPVFDMPTRPRDPSDRSLQAFKDKMDDASEASKNKKKNARDAKKKHRIMKQQDMLRQLKRAQRYLGLRPRNEDDSELSPGVEKNGNEYVRRAINVADPAPHSPDMDVVFISIDLEVYERQHSLVTEIGVSTLDTRDIGSLPPGLGAAEWCKLIRARHFRIKENAHHNNTEFVTGCADKFDQGESEFISIHDAPAIVASCFKEPFSKPQVTTEDKVETTDSLERQSEKRNIIFVGHNPGADIAFLKQMGYDMNTLSNLVEVMDTALLHRCLTQEVNPRSLGNVLADLDIAGWNLHNAGNDAFFTLEAMLAICVKDAQNWGNNEITEYQKKIVEERVAAAKRLAEERTREEHEGWDRDEADDGGIANEPHADGWFKVPNLMD
ncbi:hypothetical protein MBLNU457_6399t1 [Dothideomycetes sp. NU457]